MKLCLYCEKEIIRGENQLIEHWKVKKFCNQSCAAKYNNKRNPKLQPQGKCKDCHCATSTQYIRCVNCRTIKKNNLYLYTKLAKLTIKEASEKYSRHLQMIRREAQYICSFREQKCIKCSYNKSVDVCHIKPISNFEKTALVFEINHPDNLILLCPNCHWDFDHPNYQKSEKICERNVCPYTKGEVLYEGQNKFTYIRVHARNSLFRKDFKCSKCNYDKHVEICHITPIKDFDDNTLVEYINRSENIMILCPNCHREFDLHIE